VSSLRLGLLQALFFLPLVDIFQRTCTIMQHKNFILWHRTSNFGIPLADEACGAATGATGAAGAAGLEVPNRLSKSVRLDLRLCSDSGAGIGAAF
jgi:hypothetical protein